MSDNKMVVVASFPDPEEPQVREGIFTRAKEVYGDIDGVELHIAIREAARDVLRVFEADVVQEPNHGLKYWISPETWGRSGLDDQVHFLNMMQQNNPHMIFIGSNPQGHFIFQSIDDGTQLLEVTMEKKYPYESGDHTVLGPECFTDGNVIAYKGENYYRGCDRWVTDVDGEQSMCVKPVRHPSDDHEDRYGNIRNDPDE